MQKLSSFRGKTKNRPKKSLTRFFHAALQLVTTLNTYQLINDKCYTEHVSASPPEIYLSIDSYNRCANSRKSRKI